MLVYMDLYPNFFSYLSQQADKQHQIVTKNNIIRTN